MANTSIFKTKKVNRTKAADTVNEAGGRAYKLTAKESLAQYAATGTFGGTYYSTAKTQLDELKEILNKVSKLKDGYEFIGKVAIYSRENGLMKDMPAYLLSYLAFHAPEVYEQIFSRIIDNGKMLRNHVQFVRSGQISGKRSMPRAMRRQIKKWFENRSNDRLFKDTVGNDPSMADVIKMVHPSPRDEEQEATFGYILGKEEINESRLPKLVKQYEKFKNNRRCKVPDVPFQMLDSLGLTDAQWKKVAENAKWHMTRMNLNTFNRHGVFKDSKMVKMIANRLKDEAEISRAKAFPYQLMSAYLNAGHDVPNAVQNALQEAMELATLNVPNFGDNVWVFIDVSGSMSSPITGTHGRRVSSKMRAIDVATLIGATILRNNPDAKVIPFDTSLKRTRLNGKDSIMTNAEKLTKNWGGGTNCSLGPSHIASKKAKCDVCIIVSDNESWLDSNGENGNGWYRRSTGTMAAWDKIKKQNPNAKLVNIDLTPYGTVQAPNRDDILNVGGFSDVVWDVIKNFAENGRSGKHWVDFIKKNVHFE
jgi:60 kDa SS-A/Ro ribonucleoprotein